tara:strand:- start:221 stop:619 length:399 start_codon:yes stop_codon:yes gene_type:complete
LYSQGEFYGNIFDDKENNLNFKATELKNLKYESVQISGVIQSSCPMKGCWMEIKTNDETVFVKFKDYSFFVPVRGIKGKKATIRGDIFFDTLSVTEQKHYAYDAGKSSEEINNINKPKVIVTAIAEGVLIED